MNAVQRAIYEKVQCEGTWLVDWKQTTYEDQQAILWLRQRGYIECAAWGGLRIKGQSKIGCERKADMPMGVQ